MTTTWQIAEIKRKPDTGLVIEVLYIMNFELSGKSDRHVGVVTLTGDPTSPDFVPFESLTEEIVLGWVQTEVGAAKITEIETAASTRIQERIDRENNPEFLTGFPWEA